MVTDELIINAKTDKQAFSRVFDCYYDRILRFCYYRTSDRHHAEDITSAVFLTVAKKIKSFRGSNKDAFNAWIFKIAVNKVYDHQKKLIARNKTLQKAQQRLQHEQNEIIHDWTSLYTAITRLKPVHQTVLTLRYFQKMDFDEIAGIIDSKPATVRVILHRSIKELRNHLKETEVF